MLAPTTANATPGADFYDGAGRRWIAKGKAHFANITPDDFFFNNASFGAQRENPPFAPMSVAELAQKLRPVRLVGEYEYELAVPDDLVAARIVAMTAPPSTPGHRAASPTVASQLTPKYVIGSDDRSQVHDTTTLPGSPSGHLTNNCTLAMIGPSTALSAAHCFYFNGAWVSGGLVALGANNWGTVTTPFGTHYADSLTIPNEWISGAGSVGGAGTAGAHDGWFWDFAVLEFSPTRYPGYSTSWYGTADLSTGTQYIAGYPSEKAYRSQWLAYGTYSTALSGRYKHYIDITGGVSGACARTFTDLGSGTDWYCTGIQSSQWEKTILYNPRWNEVRRWDSTTYNFFSAYGNWP